VSGEKAGRSFFHSNRLTPKLKEFQMLKYDKNRIVPLQKKEPKPLDKNIEKTVSASGVNPEANSKKDPTANLFEDHIRELNKDE
jgi:hypothetical protein